MAEGLTPRAVNDVLAEAGQEKLREHESLAEYAAYGKSHDGLPKRAILTSDAETGWVLCITHGHVKSVGPDGKWARSGLCEWCFKQDFDPERIARRVRETSGVSGQEEAEIARRASREAEVVAARLEGAGAGAAPVSTTPEPGAVAQSTQAKVRELPSGTTPLRVDGREGVGESQDARGSAGGSPDGTSDLASQWLRIAGVE